MQRWVPSPLFSLFYLLVLVPRRASSTLRAAPAGGRSADAAQIGMAFDLATGEGSIASLTGEALHGLAQLRESGVLLETQLNALLAARDRLRHQINHLVRSNSEMAAFLAGEMAGDEDLLQAVRENEGIVGKKVERILEIEETIRRSLPHAVPQPLRFDHPLPAGIRYRPGEPTGEEERKAEGAPGGSRILFGGIEWAEDAPAEEGAAGTAEAKADGGIYL